MLQQITDTIQRPDWLDESIWPFAIRTYQHHGKPVHYLDEGEGPVVVLIHAGMWSFQWRDLIKNLRSDFRCVALDYPGAGLTPGDAPDVDLAAFVDLTVDWLDHLHIDDAVYLFHDLGGVVAVNTAARRIHSVRGLAAVNSFAWPPHTRMLRFMFRRMGGPLATWLLGTLRIVPRMTRGTFGVGRQYSRADRRGWYAPYRISRAAGRNFHRVMGSALRSPALFESADAALRHELAGTPLLTVFGEKNDPFGFARIWHSRFPHATAHVVDGGNHFPMCDAPDDLATWFRSWWTKRTHELGS